MSTFYMGLDLGQAKDYTAIAILEELVYAPPAGGWTSVRDLPMDMQGLQRTAVWYQWQKTRPGKPPLHVRHLERFPLGTPYPSMVDKVVTLLATPPLRGDTTLIADKTGVGAPVIDLLRQSGIEVISVTITGGNQVNFDRGYHVPKRDLVSTAQVLLQGERLKIAETLPLARVLVQEFLNFQVKITASAHDVYGAWREGSHDDLVLAVALAAWFRERMHRQE